MYNNKRSKEGYFMERRVGTISRGIRCPIIREGDDLVKITVESVLLAAESENLTLIQLFYKPLQLLLIKLRNDF